MKEKKYGIGWTDLWFFVFLHLHYTHDVKLYVAFIPYVIQIVVAVLWQLLDHWGVLAKISWLITKYRVISQYKRHQKIKKDEAKPE